VLTPFFAGPRHCGQFSADSVAAVAMATRPVPMTRFMRDRLIAKIANIANIAKIEERKPVYLAYPPKAARAFFNLGNLGNFGNLGNESCGIVGSSRKL
jgi:hypothetical protein